LELNVGSWGRRKPTPVPKPRNHETEVIASPENDRRQRRRFTAEQKARILAAADACTERGQLGALLRREGIYSSQLATWRAHRQQHGEAGLQRQKPGRRPTKDAKDRRIEQLERENAKLERENRIQKGLLDLQRKAHEILGIALPRIEDNATDDSSNSSDSAPRRSH
jgi:transposase